MLGLLRKDLYNLAGSIKIYVIIPLLFAFLSFTNQDMTMMAFGTSFVALFVVISSCAYDEMSQFTSYALTLPIFRKDLVLSKYLMGNIFSILLYLISIVMATGMYLIFGADQFPAFDPMEFTMFALVAAMAANICISVLLVIIFKFGTEKGRIVFLVMFLIIGLSGGVLSALNITFPFELLNSVSDEAFFIGITILSFIAELGGILISNRIMQHKES